MEKNIILGFYRNIVAKILKHLDVHGCLTIIKLLFALI